MIVSGYPPRWVAGAEVGCQRLSHALGRRGHRVHVLTRHDSQQPETVDEAAGVTVHRLLKPLAIGPLWGATYMRQVSAHMKRLAKEWDIAVCHQLYLHSLAANATAKKLGKKSVTLLVNAGEYSDLVSLREHKMGDALVRRAIEADALFALSNWSALELAREGAAVEKIWRYRYFADLPDATVPMKERTDCFLYVGRFHHQKNLPLLIEAFERVYEQHPEVRLRVVGAGPDEETVRAAWAKSPARDAIAIEGWHPRPHELYANAMAVVSGTRSEGLSNAMIEALGCGTPVIMPDVSGVRDALDVAPKDNIASGGFLEGKGGLVCRIGDAAGLANAMTHYWKDHELRARLSTDARRRAYEFFSEESSVPAFERALRAIQSNAPASAAERGFDASLFERQTQ